MASRTHQARAPAPVLPAAGQRVALLRVAALELERPDGIVEAAVGVLPAAAVGGQRPAPGTEEPGPIAAVCRAAGAELEPLGNDFPTLLLENQIRVRFPKSINEISKKHLMEIRVY